MPYIEEIPEKAFYKIGEVAEIFGVNTSLIRYWEKEFKELKPFKNKKGTRFFTRKDMETFQLIFYLVKEQGYTLQGAKDILATKNREILDKKRELYNSLTKIKSFLLDIKAEL